MLEQWMTPELYAGTDAPDEYHLLKALGKEQAAKMLKEHRDTFVQEADFKWISDYGIDTVRIPVGHWLFEDKAPYIQAKAYLDQAFKWATKYGVNVMLDVHAAVGCQNGFDNGGLSGTCSWHEDPKNVEETLDLIKQLAKTYKHEKMLAGIELLNEPRWDVPLDIIQDFYVKGYNIVRDVLGNDCYVVFHDAFRLNMWEDFFKEHAFVNVYLDTHMYQVFSHNDSLRSMSEVIEKVSIKRLNELKAVTRYVDVFVGEWSIGIHPHALNEADSPFLKEALYRAVANSLLVTFEQVSGWFFWNYNLSKESTQYNKGWSFKRAVELGYFPNKIRKELKE